MTKETPLLMCGSMVIATMEGRKTQTRRVVKPCGNRIGDDIHAPNCSPRDFDDIKKFCPYGQPGDVLWVRETWGVGTRPDPFDGWRDGIEYRADEVGLEEHDDLPLHPVKLPVGVCLSDYKQGWHPPIHMPRWASRITLEITDVRVERVQDISEADAKAEGCPVDHKGKYYDPPKDDPWQGYARYSYCLLWEKLNAHRGFGWDKNPWVWAITFKKV